MKVRQLKHRRFTCYTQQRRKVHAARDMLRAANTLLEGISETFRIPIAMTNYAPGQTITVYRPRAFVYTPA